MHPAQIAYLPVNVPEALILRSRRDAPNAAFSDRLYDLLPAFHRSEDAEQGYPLRALLRVINEQVDVIGDDIAQLYDDWFIETCADWVVPYIGDLIGYRPVHQAGDPGDPATRQGGLPNRYLIPRREVANTIALRRRKGTLSALTDLVADVGAWPGFAEEFYRRLGWTQHLNHMHPKRGRILDLRNATALDAIGGAFDRSAHTVDVRRVDSHRGHGRYNIPSVGAFVFRMKSYPVTATPAYCQEGDGPQCYAFSVLGNDAPLYTMPQDQVVPASELTLPVAIRRLAFQQTGAGHPPPIQASPAYYGAGRSLAIYAPDWPKKGATQPIPVERIVPADLSGWTYKAERGTVAVDPATGRILFPTAQLPKQGVYVDYHYGFVADIGGGEYARPILQPTLAEMARFQLPDLVDVPGLVARLQQTGDALAVWLRKHFTAATTQMIDGYTSASPPSNALIDGLLSGLNAVLEADDLYGTDRFPDTTKFPPELSQWIAVTARAPLAGPAQQRMNRLLLEAAFAGMIATAFNLYQIGDGKLAAHRRTGAMDQGPAALRRHQFTDSGVYTEPVSITLPQQTLQLRAAERTRPVLRMLDYMSDKPDAFALSGGAGSRFVLDGLLISGRGLQISGPERGVKPALRRTCAKS